jgi:hypothetical protein
MYLRRNSQVTAHYTLAEESVVQVCFSCQFLGSFSLSDKFQETQQGTKLYQQKRNELYSVKVTVPLHIHFKQTHLLEVLLRYSLLSVLGIREISSRTDIG